MKREYPVNSVGTKAVLPALLFLFLTAATCPLFAQKKCSAGDKIKYLDTYTLNNNLCGRKHLEPGWEACIEYLGGLSYEFTWKNFIGKPGVEGRIKSFQCSMFGAFPYSGCPRNIPDMVYSGNKGKVLPVRANAGKDIIIEYAYKTTGIEGADGKGAAYNITFECWYQKEENLGCGGSANTHEVMFFLKSVDIYQNEKQFVEVRKFGDTKWIINRNPEHNGHQFIKIYPESFVIKNNKANGSVPSAKINMRHFNDYFISKGWMTDEYLLDVEAGGEIVRGSGTCTVSKFEVTVGSGATDIHSPIKHDIPAASARPISQGHETQEIFDIRGRKIQSNRLKAKMTRFPEGCYFLRQTTRINAMKLIAW